MNSRCVYYSRRRIGVVYELVSMYVYETTIRCLWRHLPICHNYGVALVDRLHKIIGLFFKRAL